MRKLFVGLVMMFFFAGVTAYADPFLWCDPSADAITQVQVEITKAAVPAPIVTVVPGTYIVVGAEIKLLDLGSLASGTYKFRARWSAAGGLYSDWSLPLDNIAKGASPGSLRVH